MASGVAQLVVKVVSDTRSATKGLDDVTSRADRMKRGLGTAAKAATGVLVGLGAAAVSAGRAAAEDARGQALLANAMKNSAGASKESIAATEEWIDKTARATGVADDQLRPAMASLVRSTGSATKAQEAMNVALDVAAATGKPVESVANAMAKGFAGTTSSLGRLVPGLDAAALKAGDMSAVMDDLQAKTGGAAAAAAESTSGQFDRMTVAIDEAKESLGAGLLPIMSMFAGVLATVGGFVSEHVTLFQTLAVILAGLAVTVIAVNAAVKAYRAITLIATAAQAAFNLVMALNPVVLVVIAVVALIAALVLLVKKNETVRAAFLAAWNAIKAGVSAVADFLKAVWDKITAAAKVVAGAVQAAWEATWEALKTAATTVRDWVVEKFQALRDKVGDVASAVTKAWDAVWDGLKSAVSGLGAVLSAPFDAVASAVDWVVGKVQDLLDLIGKIKIPDLPGLGDLVPFAASSAASAAGLGALSTPSTRSTTGGGVNIVVNGAVDPEATARQIRRILAGHDRRVGLQP